jgi:hydroxymethylpyrimidine/phosphomethylpyrimidine kinase
VVDPVMLPTRHVHATGRGASLHGGAVREVRTLAFAAALVTPNLAEAAALLGVPVSAREARDAAAALVSAGARAALVKGGHGGGAEAVDWLAVRGRVVRIARPRRRGPEVHGTGCALASLIAGRLAATGASGPDDVVAAVRWARGRLDRALAAPLVVGKGLRVLDVRVRWRA